MLNETKSDNNTSYIVIQENLEHLMHQSLIISAAVIVCFFILFGLAKTTYRRLKPFFDNQSHNECPTYRCPYCDPPPHRHYIE